jgi:hypothetical protein
MVGTLTLCPPYDLYIVIAGLDPAIHLRTKGSRED